MNVDLATLAVILTSSSLACNFLGASPAHPQGICQQLAFLPSDCALVLVHGVMVVRGIALLLLVLLEPGSCRGRQIQSLGGIVNVGLVHTKVMRLCFQRCC